ncbi:hypothetical protein NEOC84_001669|nr:hypothetical protein [Neochlamydia sp. AcF95]NGY95744.1 hypothetical protein [Neochlamydia sp. AcF84]
MIDDTREEKPCTDKNRIACWHFFIAKESQVKKINLFLSIINKGDYTFPNRLK